MKNVIRLYWSSGYVQNKPLRSNGWINLSFRKANNKSQSVLIKARLFLNGEPVDSKINPYLHFCGELMKGQ